MPSLADGLYINGLGDVACRHGVALDVHCCYCHTGFIFDRNHVCDEPDEEATMNINTGKIYEDYEAAKQAGVPDDLLVTGTRPALENLRTRLKFSKGSFKPVAVPPATQGGDE